MSSSNKFNKKFFAALHGVSVAKSFPDPTSPAQIKSYEFKSTEPPSYVVRLVFVLLAGSDLPSGQDKSAWAIPIDFDGSTWVVEDWRRYSWHLSGPVGRDKSAKLLAKKIRAAGSILNSFLQEYGREAFKSDEISLQNQFSRTRGLYEYFRDQVENPPLKPEPTMQGEIPEHTPEEHSVTQLFGSLMGKLFDEAYSGWASTAAVVVFFFAHLEVIMDSCFSLSPRKGLTFAAFRQLEWLERFKHLLPVNEPDVQAVYVAIDRVRKQYRNAFAHSTPIFFVTIPGAGLVPMDSEHLSEPRWEPPIAFTREKAIDVFKTLDDTIELFRSRPETKFGFRYAETDLPIHINQAHAQELIDLTADPIAFEAEMKTRMRIQDAIENMEL
ncbi:MAG TPA: hypothetical protein VF794_16315 [Archangium sp.]|jgi:hypothetical protein|uniref:hypothetical protein n=1 Tax=Archangium sp. TaxID=1872627 RepID=UPI002EDA07FB